MRDAPLSVGRIAVEPPSHLVPHAAPGHGPQGVADDLQGGFVLAALPGIQQKLQPDAGRELGRPFKAAVVRVVPALHRGERPIHQHGIGRHGRGLPARLVPAHRRRVLGGDLQHVLRPLFPDLVQGL